ncbi:hypothetical protein METP1_03375 [Methanosarcinales archaeon]|nr:hypothetical protein METP1_03375 [Methanosarcinales archaeon]
MSAFRRLRIRLGWCPNAAMLNKKHNNIHKYALFFHLCVMDEPWQRNIKNLYRRQIM